MKIELYLVQEDENGRRIKKFLINNNLPFKEITDNTNSISKLRITYSHSIHVIDGFQEWILNQLLEHIKKYKPIIRN